MRALLQDRSGGAAVEMAIVAPVLVGMALLGFEVWKIGVGQQQAAAALDVAADYYMTGGLSDEAAVQAARNAWRDAPPNAEVTAVRSARCGQAEVEMTALCAGGRAPAIYATLTASGSRTPDGEVQVRATRLIRVR